MTNYNYKLPADEPDEVIESGNGRIWHRTYDGLRTSVRHLVPGNYKLIIPSPELIFIHDGEVSVRTTAAAKDGYGGSGFSSGHVFAPVIGQPLEVLVRSPDDVIWDHTGHSGVDGFTYTSFHLESDTDLETALRLAVEDLGGVAITSTLHNPQDYFRIS